MSENDKIEYQMEDCAQYVKEWLKYDDEIKQYNDNIKSLKQKQSELSHYILHYMNEKGIEHLTFDGGRLECNVKKTKGGLSKKYVSTCVKDFFRNDEVKTNELLEKLLNNRETKETRKLKRTIM
tara:strand:- start:3838 stop:4209 length:372 start_codon:yes stop_codon:yes gene_type:complete